MVDRVKTKIIEKNGVELSFDEEYDLTASNVYFDNTGTEYTSDNIGDTLKEIEDKVGVSASPGFSWGRSGNASTGTWLQNDTVPSNRVGRTINLVNPVITAVSIANRDVSTFTVAFYEHEGNSINLTQIGTVDIINARSLNAFVNLPVTEGKQLAVRILSGAASNPVIGLQLSGEVA